MNKRWRNIGLGALLVLAIVVIAPAFFGGGGGSQPQVNTIRYSEFVEAVKDDQISRVLISPDQGTAQVVENDGRRAQVNLAPDRELLGLLTEHSVPFLLLTTSYPTIKPSLSIASKTNFLNFDAGINTLE